MFPPKNWLVHVGPQVHSQQLWLGCCFFHILQKTSRSGANLLLPLLGTAVSTSASFDSWIYGYLWMVVLPLTAVPAQNSGLRPKNSVKCAHPPHQRWCYHVLMCYLSCLTAVATLAISKPTYEAQHILHHYSREDLRVTRVGCLFLPSSRAQVCCRIPTFCTQDKTLGVDSVIKQH